MTETSSTADTSGYSSTSGSLVRYPYVGPRPFEPEDQSVFFGRDAEISELLSLVISHRAVLFYSESGAGKSSLINAGLIPELEKEGFEILPTARVQGLLKETDPETIENVYIFNTILCLYGILEKQVEVERLKRKSLKDFLTEIERPINEAGHQMARMLIFDQFEELFTFYPERWTDRTDFFKQVQEALEADPLLRVVFTMREDYIAQLDPYVSYLPQNLRTRFRLERLRRDAALEAVTKPLKGTIREFAEGVDDLLVDELMEVRVETEGGKILVVKGEFVEPVQLQVVCQTLWRSLPPETITITAEDLNRFGDVDNALSKFYERAIKSTVKSTGVKEGELRRWFEQKLLTPSGTRGTVYRGQTETAGLGNQAVAELENLHLLRGERRGGASWYELTHDRFIDPILQSNRQWLAERQSAEDTRQKFEANASEWAKRGRAGELLLDELQLREAQAWLTSKEASELSQSETLIAFIEASRSVIEESKRQAEIATARQQTEEQRLIAETERRRVRQLKLAMFSSLVFAALALAFGFSAYYANSKAEQAEEEVVSQQALIDNVAQNLPQEAQPSSSQVSRPKHMSDGSGQYGGPQRATPIVPSQDTRLNHGFIYYGQRSGDGWKFRFFKRQNGPADGMPAKNDLVAAIQAVYARAGAIGKDQSTRKIGTVAKDEQVYVEAVIVQQNHVWIEFVKPEQ